MAKTHALLLLLVGIVIEVGASANLPRTRGFQAPGWTVAVVSGYAVSIWLLAVVVRTLPVSVVYAVWSGAGTAAVAAIGTMFLGESMGWAKATCLAFIIVGVVGLNLVST